MSNKINNLKKWWGKLKPSEKNYFKSLAFAIPTMWVFWYYLKLYTLFGIRNEDFVFIGYAILIMLATGIWANILNQSDVMRKLNDKKK